MGYVQYTPRKSSEAMILEKLNSGDKLLGFYKNECGYRYSLVKFHKCGHECYIGVGKNLQCNDKKCLSERMSRVRKISHNKPEVKEKMRRINIENNAKPEVKAKHGKFFREYWSDEGNRKQQAKKKSAFFASEGNRKTHSERLKEYYATHKEYKAEIEKRLNDWRNNVSDEELEEINIKRIKKMNTPESREKVSHAVKKYFSDAENKKEYLIRVAEQQRKRQNKYEMMFIKLLEDHHVDYVWQYPIITEEGKGFVVDFYLPEYQLYVNIDGSIHGFNGKINNSLVNFRASSDCLLDDYCDRKGLNICHVDTRDLKGLNFNLKEAIGI